VLADLLDEIRVLFIIYIKLRKDPEIKKAIS